MSLIKRRIDSRPTCFTRSLSCFKEHRTNACFDGFNHQIQFVPSATHPCDSAWPTGCGLNSSPRHTCLGCGRLDHPGSPMHRRMGASLAKHAG